MAVPLLSTSLQMARQIITWLTPYKNLNPPMLTGCGGIRYLWSFRPHAAKAEAEGNTP
jgi:hypothetical protein